MDTFKNYPAAKECREATGNCPCTKRGILVLYIYSEFVKD